MMAKGTYRICNVGFDSITVYNFHTSPPIPSEKYNEGNLLAHYNLPEPSAENHILLQKKGCMSSVTITGPGYSFKYGNRRSKKDIVPYANITLYAFNESGNNLCNMTVAEIPDNLRRATDDLYGRFGLGITWDYQNLCVTQPEVNCTIPLFDKYNSYERPLELMQSCDAKGGAYVMSGYTMSESGEGESISYRNDTPTKAVRIYNKSEELKKKEVKKCGDSRQSTISLSTELSAENEDFLMENSENPTPDYCCEPGFIVDSDIDFGSDSDFGLDVDYKADTSCPDFLRFEIKLKKPQSLRNFIKREIQTNIDNDSSLTAAEKDARKKYYNQVNVLPLYWINDNNLGAFYSDYIDNLASKINNHLNEKMGTYTLTKMRNGQKDIAPPKLSSASCTDVINWIFSENSLRGIMLRNAITTGFDNSELLAIKFFADVAEQENGRTPSTYLLDVTDLKELFASLPLPQNWRQKQIVDFYACFERVCIDHYPTRYIGQAARLREILQKLKLHQEHYITI